MSKKKNISLSSKFLPPILIVTLIALSVGAFLIFDDVKKSTFQNIDNAQEALNTEQSSAEATQLSALQSKSDLLGQFMATTAPDFILSYDFTSLVAFQEQAAKDSDVAYSAYLKPTGEVMTEYTAPEDMSMILENRYPIISDDEELGFVLIGMSKKLLNQAVEESNQRIDSAIENVSSQGEATLDRFKTVGGINIVVLMVAIAISLMVLFRIFVVKPLQQLKGSAYELSHGNLDLEIDTSRRDELGSLAESFAEMRDSIRKKISDLSILNNTGEELAGLHSQTKALETAMRVMGEQTHVKYGSVYLFDGETDTLTLRAYYPEHAPPPASKPRAFRLGEGIAGKAALEKTIIYIPNTAEDNSFVPGHEDEGPRSIIAVPMLDDGKIFGIMNFSGQVGKVKFDESDQDFAENISRMTVVTSKNIQMLQVIEEQNRTLEQKVEQRTAALNEKTHDINSMLQNMHQGIFTIHGDNQVHPEYSAYLETILETDQVEGENVLELLFTNSDLGSNATDQIKAALAAILGEDAMMFDFNRHLFVSEYKLSMSDGREKILELDWDPITSEDDVVDKLMVTVRDVTELRGLQAEAEKQKWELDVIGQILAVSESKFVEFTKTSFEFIEQNEKLIRQTNHFDVDTVASLFRNMHTIKGNARTYGFCGITDTVHEAEQSYDDLRKSTDPQWDQEILLKELGDVFSIINTYHTVYQDKLASGSHDGIFMDTELLSKAKDALEHVNYTDTKSLRDTLGRIRSILGALDTETVSSVVEGIISSISKVAESLGKIEPKIVIEDHDIRLSSDIAPVLRNVLTHGFRNSLDHGLEAPAERAAAGKPEQGTITLSVENEGNGVVLKLYDDGRGLALERIRQKAIDCGILGADTEMTDEELAGLIFHSGFSTAEQVSDVSGRGVGMDAVKRFLKDIGGDISIHLTGNVNSSGFRQFESCITLPEEYTKKVA